MRKVNFCNVFFQVLYSETSEKLCRLSTFLVKISSQSGFFYMDPRETKTFNSSSFCTISYRKKNSTYLLLGYNSYS